MSKDQISIRQLTIMIFLFTLGDSILVLPSTVIYSAKQDAWISGIIGLGCGSAILNLYYKVSRIDSKINFFEICDQVMGKWIGRMISFIYILYCYLSVALLMRELGAFFLTHFLIRTPMQVVMGLFVFTVAIAVRMGVVSISRTSEILFPVVLLLISFLFFMLIYKINFKEFIPIGDKGIKPIIKGTIPFSAFVYMEIVSIMLFFPLVKEKNLSFFKIWLPSFLGGLVLVITICYSIAILGADAAGNSLYPTLKLAQKIRIGMFFQRLDIIVATLWLVSMFFKTVFYYFFAIRGIGMVLTLKDQKSLTFPLAFLAIPIGLNAAENIVNLNDELLHIWPFYDFTVSFLLPSMILSVSYMKKWRKNRINNKQKEEDRNI